MFPDRDPEVSALKTLEHVLRKALQERQGIEAELRAYVAQAGRSSDPVAKRDHSTGSVVGLLGHDRSSPLDTLLTAVRVMRLRPDLSSAIVARLDRVIASAEHSERMVRLLLDLTSTQLGEGIALHLEAPRDVAAVVAHVVETARAGHPGREIALHEDGECRARIDPERFEQVASTLLENATTHGDPARPIEVRIEARAGQVELTVHNFGPATIAADQAQLLDPFKRVLRPADGGERLELGLFLAKTIIAAHGGRLDVHSTATAGTTFLATVPLA
jgi:phosphoserine phosphatase RsbU/P